MIRTHFSLEVETVEIETVELATVEPATVGLGPVELETATRVAPLPPDHRPYMPEPPPVRLVAIEDVRAAVSSGADRALDWFYVDLLRLEREASPAQVSSSCTESSAVTRIAYKAENHRLLLDVLEPPIVRGDMRTIGIEVPSLAEVERGLIAREWEYERLRDIVVGGASLMLCDPGGNWVAITEMKRTA